jgi:hypothetical protein
MRRTWFVLGAALLPVFATGAALSANPPPPEVATEAADTTAYELVPISKVLVQVSREARVAWDKDKSWPTDKSDFAQRKKLRVENAELLGALARKINPEPAIDAYIKLQLLSFEPDFTLAEPEQIQRIIKVMPKLEAAPVPKLPDPPTKMPSLGMGVNMSQTTVRERSVRAPDGKTAPSSQRLSTVNSGTAMVVQGTASDDGRYVMARIEAAQTNLVRLRKLQVTANRPLTDFRDALTAAMPMDGGVRLAAMMQDLWQRIEAGDKTYERVVDRLVKEADAVAPGKPGVTRDAPLTPKARANLANEMAKFAALKVPIAEAVYPGTGKDEGKMLTRGYVAQVPPEKLKLIIIALVGETPTERSAPPAPR